MNQFESSQIGEMVCVPCYGGLSIQQQTKVFEPAPYGKRKVIVSSNIAETGVTIEGVCFVVDCCLTKITVFDNEADCEHLITIPASKANCVQRAGRAGRVRPGKCYRLCTQEFYET